MKNETFFLLNNYSLGKMMLKFDNIQKCETIQ